jgi:hypothetical protein
MQAFTVQAWAWVPVIDAGGRAGEVRGRRVGPGRRSARDLRSRTGRHAHRGAVAPGVLSRGVREAGPHGRGRAQRAAGGRGPDSRALRPRADGLPDAGARWLRCDAADPRCGLWLPRTWHRRCRGHGRRGGASVLRTRAWRYDVGCFVTRR